MLSENILSIHNRRWDRTIIIPIDIARRAQFTHSRSYRIGGLSNELLNTIDESMNLSSLNWVDKLKQVCSSKDIFLAVEKSVLATLLTLGEEHFEANRDYWLRRKIDKKYAKRQMLKRPFLNALQRTTGIEVIMPQKIQLTYSDKNNQRTVRRGTVYRHGPSWLKVKTIQGYRTFISNRIETIQVTSEGSAESENMERILTISIDRYANNRAIVALRAYPILRE